MFVFRAFSITRTLNITNLTLPTQWNWSDDHLVQIHANQSCTSDSTFIPTPHKLTPQAASQVAQSILVGNLAHYFSIVDPTEEETRHVYLSAAGLL